MACLVHGYHNGSLRCSRRGPSADQAAGLRRPCPLHFLEGSQTLQTRARATVRVGGFRDGGLHPQGGGSGPASVLGRGTPAGQGAQASCGLAGSMQAGPQYSQSAAPQGASASARSSPEAPPRRYLPLRARMARRPRSRNSKTKSSARSPSLHTLPWLPVFQKPPRRPAGGWHGVGGRRARPSAAPGPPRPHLGSGRRRR